jgi:hypothetical protein
MNKNAITIKVTPSLQDFRWLLLHALKTKLPIILGSMCVLAVIFSHKDFVYTAGSMTRSMYIVRLVLDFLPIPLFFPIALLGMRLYTGIKWKHTPELREDRVYDITGEDIRIISKSFNFTFGWEKIKKVVFTKKRVVLINTTNQFYVLPTESFADETLETFTTIVKQQVKDVKFAL